MCGRLDSNLPPTDLGGLGIPDLRLASIALQARWLWLKHTDATRAWAQLPIKASREVAAFFDASTFTLIGNGQSTAFWTARWIQGKAVKDIAPTLLEFVSRRDIVETTVAAGLDNRSWVRQITGGSITVPAVVEYLRLWDLLTTITLGTGDDKLIWRWTADGLYSFKSASRALLAGSSPVYGCPLI
jgi:hypothetical protein